MICSFCRKAGDLNTEANRINFGSVADAEKLRVEVREWHARCNNRCNCQHIVGQVLDHKHVLEPRRETNEGT